MGVPILTPVHHWVCHLCGATSVTHEARPHARFHTCPKLGLVAPMVEAGTKAKVTPIEREDYVGNELVQTNAEGRPIQSVVVEREDGQDTTVYAPTARADLDL